MRYRLGRPARAEEQPGPEGGGVVVGSETVGLPQVVVGAGHPRRREAGRRAGGHGAPGRLEPRLAQADRQPGDRHHRRYEQPAAYDRGHDLRS